MCLFIDFTGTIENGQNRGITGARICRIKPSTPYSPPLFYVKGIDRLASYLLNLQKND
jgi:hypothetical protein